jgi:hypothetical protein
VAPADLRTRLGPSVLASKGVAERSVPGRSIAEVNRVAASFKENVAEVRAGTKQGAKAVAGRSPVMHCPC